MLAERLAAANADVAVLNEGIGGDRVLRTRMGENALARFDRDVLSHPRADTVVLMMGINDIGWPGTLLVPGRRAGARAPRTIIAGYEQLIDARARQRLRDHRRDARRRSRTPSRAGRSTASTTPTRKPSAWRSTTGSAPAAASTR